MTRLSLLSSLPVMVFLMCACGSDDAADVDAAVDSCGNGVLEQGERCDDGNDVDADECTNACVFSCGDGIVQAHESCDEAILEGEPGACPTDGDAQCDDGVSCTRNVVVGERCEAACDNPAIEAFIDGDGCCPSIADAIEYNDFDCDPVCGNGLVELSETCDSAIGAGQPGACPAAPADCDDGVACTDDTFNLPDDGLPGDGACRATCEYAARTAVVDDDGCCAPGADDTTDNDCVYGTATCGDGLRRVAQGELCDTGIAEGEPGACPTACPADDTCTNALLLSAGTCKATCHEWPTIYTINDDECCPTFYGGNNRNDNDCTTSCGTPAEECTVGSADCDVNCRIIRTALRITEITLQDPHIFWDLGTGACPDLTAVANSSVFPGTLTSDDDGDGWADLTIINMFKPLNQVDTESTPMDLLFGECFPSQNPALTQCIADPLTGRVELTATNTSVGTCLDVIPDTVTESYATPPVPVEGPCYTTNTFDEPTFGLGDLIVPLQNATIAATYDADPATGLINGMLVGFVSEEAAQGSIIPDTVALIGGLRLSDIMAGGIAPGSCDVVAGTPIGDDRDLGPDDTTLGWYFYINFVAEEVPLDDRPNASTQ